MMKQLLAERGVVGGGMLDRSSLHLQRRLGFRLPTSRSSVRWCIRSSLLLRDERKLTYALIAPATGGERGAFPSTHTHTDDLDRTVPHTQLIFPSVQTRAPVSLRPSFLLETISLFRFLDRSFLSLSLSYSLLLSLSFFLVRAGWTLCLSLSRSLAHTHTLCSLLAMPPVSLA